MTWVLLLFVATSSTLYADNHQPAAENYTTSDALAVPVGQAQVMGEEPTPEATAPVVSLMGPPAKTKKPEQPSGQVSEVGKGVVLINIGRDDGLKLKDRVRFFTSNSKGKTHNWEMESDGVTVERESGRGSIQDLGVDRAVVALDRGSEVYAGDSAQAQPRRIRNFYPIAPERIGGVGETIFTIRPALVLEGLGAAVLMDFATHYHFNPDFYVSAQLQPIGFGHSRTGTSMSLSALASGGYDHRYFSVGLGFGFMTKDYPQGSGYFGFGSVAISQEVRFGARNGLNLFLRNTFVKNSDKFEYGNVLVDINIPVNTQFDVRIQGVTGLFGPQFIEAGLRSWVIGNGNQGSLGIDFAAGFGGLQNAYDPAGFLGDSVAHYGPLISAGVRHIW